MSEIQRKLSRYSSQNLLYDCRIGSRIPVLFSTLKSNPKASSSLQVLRKSSNNDEINSNKKPGKVIPTSTVSAFEDSGYESSSPGGTSPSNQHSSDQKSSSIIFETNGEAKGFSVKSKRRIRFSVDEATREPSSEQAKRSSSKTSEVLSPENKRESHHSSASSILPVSEIEHCSFHDSKLAIAKSLPSLCVTKLEQDGQECSTLEEPSFPKIPGFSSLTEANLKCKLESASSVNEENSSELFLCSSSSSLTATMVSTTNSFQNFQKEMDSNLSEIFQQCEMEFGEKYFDWIKKLFELHISKIHHKFKKFHQDRVDEIHKDRNLKIFELQRKYRKKILEFENTTEKFQRWYNDVISYNRRLLTNYEKLLIEFNGKETELIKHCESECREKFLQIEADFENEKSKLILKHAEEIKIKERKQHQEIIKLKEFYEAQISMLKRSKENIEEGIKDDASFNEDASKMQPKRNATEEDALFTLEEKNATMELKEKIAFWQEKALKSNEEIENLKMQHSNEISKLNTLLDENNKKLEEVTEAAKDASKSASEERAKSILTTNRLLAHKEKAHQLSIEQLTRNYGKKIEILMENMQKLRKKMEIGNFKQENTNSNSINYSTPLKSNSPMNESNCQTKIRSNP